jgi:hypothetical protein
MRQCGILRRQPYAFDLALAVMCSGFVIAKPLPSTHGSGRIGDPKA